VTVEASLEGFVVGDGCAEALVEDLDDYRDVLQGALRVLSCWAS
jgi:hypothetical protein